MTTGYLFDLDETLVTYEPEVPGIFRNACGAVAANDRGSRPALSWERVEAVMA